MDRTCWDATALMARRKLPARCRRNRLWKRRGEEKSKTDFPSPLGNPANYAGFPLSHSLDGGWFTLKPDISCANKTGHFNLLRTESRKALYWRSTEGRAGSASADFERMGLDVEFAPGVEPVAQNFRVNRRDAEKLAAGDRVRSFGIAPGPKHTGFDVNGPAAAREREIE